MGGSETGLPNLALRDLGKIRMVMTPRTPTTKQGTADKSATKLKDALQVVQSKTMACQDYTVALLKNPDFQTCTIATLGGTVTFGAVGGAFGLASGVVVGSAAGVVPALFTFGLSIPAGAVVGGTAGLALGAATGGGFGGISACGAYKYRVEIKNRLVFIKIKTLKTFDDGKCRALMLGDLASRSASNVANATKSRAVVLKNKDWGHNNFSCGRWCGWRCGRRLYRYCSGRF